jgi:hypothetical protein
VGGRPEFMTGIRMAAFRVRTFRFRGSGLPGVRGQTRGRHYCAAFAFIKKALHVDYKENSRTIHQKISEPSAL